MKTQLLAAAAFVLALASNAEAQATAGVPASINVGNGQATAAIPSGLGGLSTGTTAQFTPGAAIPGTASPYYVATNAAESATLASLLTHYSQGLTAATPTTGPPKEISTGVPGGFTGNNTGSIPNAATTSTGLRSPTSENAQGQSSGADSLTRCGQGGLWKASMGVFVGIVGGAAWIL